MTSPVTDDVAVNGARLNARIDGPEGAPWLVLVNSLATDLTMWDPQIEAFTTRYRVLRYDARGHGRSPATQAPYTMNLLVDDVLGILQHYAIERAYVVGLSLGGLTAIALALRAPPQLAAIAICDSRSDMRPEFVSGIESRNALVRDKGLEAVAQVFIERWLTPQSLAGRPDLVEKIRRMVLATSPEGFVGCSEAIKTSELYEHLEAIRCPALFLVGDRDTAVPVDVMRRAQERVAGSQLVVIKSAGHVSNLEQPEAFNDAVLNFFAGIH